MYGNNKLRSKVQFLCLSRREMKVLFWKVSFFIHVSYDLNETPELQNKFVKQLKAVMGSKLQELAFFLSPKGCLYRNKINETCQGKKKYVPEF